MELNSEQLAYRIAKLSLTKKAYDVQILDLRELTSITDYFVICSADTDIQVKAITDAIVEGMEKEDVRVWHIEGYTNLKWVLLDYVDVVVHVFEKETRHYYLLERLWGDAEITTITDDK